MDRILIVSTLVIKFKSVDVIHLNDFHKLSAIKAKTTAIAFLIKIQSKSQQFCPHFASINGFIN